MLPNVPMSQGTRSVSPSSTRTRSNGTKELFGDNFGESGANALAVLDLAGTGVTVPSRSMTMRCSTAQVAVHPNAGARIHCAALFTARKARR